jgi:asparagine synthase (glutamine-hydrolysing)
LDDVIRTTETISFSGNIRNLRELNKQFKLNNSVTVEETLLAAWHLYKMELGHYLIGEFAIYINDSVENKVTLIQDRVGGVPLYYVQQNGTAFAAFSPVDLLSNPELTFTKNIGWIARYLTVGYQYADTAQPISHETAYHEIRKLAAGVVIVFKSGEIDLQKIWHNWDTTTSKETDVNWVQRHKDLLFAAISDRIGPAKPPVIENSGGIDSSALACIASSEMTTEQRGDFTSISSNRWQIEQTWITATNQAACIKNKLCSNGQADIAMLSALNLTIKGYPAKFQPEVSLDHLAQVGQEGFETVFSGFGGDEVVTQLGMEMKGEAYNARDFKRLYALISGHPLKRPYRFFKLLLNPQSMFQLPTQIRRILDHAIAVSYVSKGVVETHGLRNTVENYVQVAGMTNSMNTGAIYALNYKPAFQARMEDHTLWGRHFGLKYEWPLLDHRLIANYLKTPSTQKVARSNVGRHLHRRAVRGIVPDIILDSDTKKMGALDTTAGLFDSIHNDTLNAANQLLAGVNAPLDDMIDLAKLGKDIARFKDQKDLDSDPNIIHFWEHVKRLSLIDYWCQHGR